MAVQTAPTPHAAPQRPRLPLPARESLPAAAAVASLVALPLLVYGVPALAGHVVAPGDDLTQSLPLRELVGRDLSSGHLPIFDPYLWSGSPLLAGWNAGAAYPLTWLFAVLPAALAWTVSLASALIAAGVGCYAFLRANGLRLVASWLGAVTFAFGGGMSAQVSHVGLVIGMAWVPLGLLAILRLTEPASGARGTAGWTAVLASAVGLVVLAGEPRAIADAATVLVLYAAWRLARLVMATRRGRARAGGAARSVVAVAGGAALGLGLGAVQLVPGLAAVATSQRAAVSSFLFSAGSLPLPWLLLLGVPDLLGGSGSWGQPGFFGSYNLTEVTGYVGMLPLAAAGALLGRFGRRGRGGWRGRFGRQGRGERRAPLPEWGVWYAVAAAGILLALGARTPLWHVLIRVPLFGDQRLQSRSLLVSGLALAVLLAYWADGWASGAGARSRRERVGATVLPAAVVMVVVVALAWPVALFEWMGVAPAVAARSTDIRPWLLPFLALAVATIVLVWSGGRQGSTGGTRSAATGRPGRSAALVAFVVVDLAVFAATTMVAVGASGPAASRTGGAASAAAPTAAGPSAAGPSAAAATRTRRSAAGGGTRPVATLHLGGRFAVYDPSLADAAQLSALGVPDANVLDGTYSVQGYGSIVDGRYARATGTHGVSGTGQDVFSPRAADDGVLDALDTAAVLVPGDSLVRTVAAGAPGGRRRTRAVDGRPDSRSVGPRRRATWELGTPRAVSAVRVAGSSVAPRHPPAPDDVRVGLVRPDGTVDWAARVTAAPGGETWQAAWPSPVQSVAVVVAAAVGAELAPPVVTAAGGAQLRPAGTLDAALVPPHWTYAGRDGAFAVYRNHEARRPLRLQALPGRSTAGATITRTGGTALAPSSARVVSPRGVTVVRAMAAIPGWSAIWTPAPTGHHRHAAETLRVRRDGVVQSVRVPAGRGTLTWRYQTPGLVTGAAVSGASLAGVLALAAAAVVAMANRRRTRWLPFPRVESWRGRTRTSNSPRTAGTSASSS